LLAKRAGIINPLWSYIMYAEKALNLWHLVLLSSPCSSYPLSLSLSSFCFWFVFSCWSVGLRRTGKSCRLRWLNYLKPDVKRGNLTPQEQLLILDLHSKWGNRCVLFDCPTLELYVFCHTSVHVGAINLPLE
jgi:hypothetical protein